MNGQGELPRQGAIHLMVFLTRLHMQVDDVVNGCGGQPLRIARGWEDVLSRAGDEGNERDGG